MAYAAELMNSLIPITLFNRGQASRIFERLHTESQLVVLKNNQPEAVILSPKEYYRLTEIEENYTLLLEAAERLKKADAATFDMHEVMQTLGIRQDEIDSAEDVIID